MDEYNISNQFNDYDRIKIGGNHIVFENKNFGKTKITGESIDSIKLKPYRILSEYIESYLIIAFLILTFSWFTISVVNPPEILSGIISTTVSYISTIIPVLIFFIIISFIVVLVIRKYFGIVVINTRSSKFSFVCERDKCKSIVDEL